MSIRLRCACRTPAVLLLFLPLFAASQLTAAEAEASTKLVRVTYQVADLVIPIPMAVHIPGGPACTSATQEGRLIKLITNTVDPRSWSAMGGPGTIDYHPMTMGLIINQTPDIQEQIQDLLQSLRRLQDQQVSLEVRFLSVDEALDKRLLREGKEGEGSQPADPCDPSLRVTFLSDDQASRLLEAAQADPKTNVTQAPKATMFDGQCSTIDATEPESFVTDACCFATPNGSSVFQPVVEEMPVGLRMTMRPVISADRRSVATALKVNLSSVDDLKADVVPIQVPITSPSGAGGEMFTQLVQRPRVSRLALEGTLKIPASKTALVRGWKRERQVRTESGPPILSDIPYLNRLFKNVGYGRETECVMMLVTPRIIIVEEEEEEIGTSKVAQASCPCERASDRCAAPAHCKQAEVAELVAKYHRACAEGRGAEATQLAVRALAIDPTCFHVEETPAVPCKTSPPKGP